MSRKSPSGSAAVTKINSDNRDPLEVAMACPVVIYRAMSTQKQAFRSRPTTCPPSRQAHWSPPLRDPASALAIE